MGFECKSDGCGSAFPTEKRMKLHYAVAHENPRQTKTCLTCGETFDFLPSQRPNAKYCSKDCHGGKIDVKCDWCNGSFSRPLSQYNENGPNYCSRECTDRAWDSRIERVCEHCGGPFSVPRCRSHQRYCSRICRTEAERVGIECANCGKKFTVPKSRANEARFCDHDCQGEWVKENHNYGVTKPCGWCGKPITRKPHQAKIKKRFFCDRGCYGHWRAENMVGEKNPNWEGGGPWYYGENWYQKRREALDRDNQQCQSCGACHGDNTRLHVHHIIPLNDFETPEEANRLGNLVALCNSCHSRWEGIPLRPQLTGQER